MTETTRPESSYLEIAYSSIRVFADDGTMDMNELNFLLGIALRDKVIDDDEKRVLGSIFRKAEEVQVSSAVRARISELRRRYSIP